VLGVVASVLLLVGFAACAVTVLRSGLPALAVAGPSPVPVAGPAAAATPSPAR
jgi:hypothetical protein